MTSDDTAERGVTDLFSVAGIWKHFSLLSLGKKRSE